MKILTKKTELNERTAGIDALVASAIAGMPQGSLTIDGSLKLKDPYAESVCLKSGITMPTGRVVDTMVRIELLALMHPDSFSALAHSVLYDNPSRLTDADCFHCSVFRLGDLTLKQHPIASLRDAFIRGFEGVFRLDTEDTTPSRRANQLYSLTAHPEIVAVLQSSVRGIGLRDSWKFSSPEAN